MKKLLPLLILFAACKKEASYQDKQDSQHILSNSTLIANATFNLQTDSTYIASLGIINPRSSYELSGTSGNNLFWPEVLQLSDTSVYPATILAEGDSLIAEVYADTTYHNHYNFTLVVTENDSMVKNKPIYNNYSMSRAFVFHNGTRYGFAATATAVQ